MVHVSEFLLSNLIRLREFVEGVFSAPRVCLSSTGLIFSVFTSLVPSEFLPAFLAESFRFAHIMISMAYNIAIWDPTRNRDLTQVLLCLPQLPQMWNCRRLPQLPQMLTCLPQLHFQMLISRLVGLSILARQMTRFYSPLSRQLGSFPTVFLHNSGKSSYGMPSHPQCDCWFSHRHAIGSSEEPSLASLDLLKGVVLRPFGIAKSSRIGWYVANVLIYLCIYKSSTFRQKLP